MHVLLITEELRLYENVLNGTIPTELGLLHDLEWLNLFSNQVTGTIPTELGLLSNLEYLALDSNRLTGTVPTTLASLPLLSKSQPLLFRYSFFTMCSHVRSSSLFTEKLYLEGNELTGSVNALCGINFEEFSVNTCGQVEINCTCCTHCCHLETGEYKCDPL